jgi:hypothetical protein
MPDTRHLKRTHEKAVCDNLLNALSIQAAFMRLEKPLSFRSNR